MTLPPEFLARPFAHRGLHDLRAGRAENSLSAMRAAINARYGIETDLQLSADRHAMVFHDHLLDRLTNATGRVSDCSADQMAGARLTGSAEGIPRLTDLLDLVAGQVPLLIELKDQSQRPGEPVGPLEAATVAALDRYDGPVALMSFQPAMVQELARIAPDIPRGLVGRNFDHRHLSAEENTALTDYRAFEATGSCFVSHKWRHLDAPAVKRLKSRGVPVLCWTIRSPDDEAVARRTADNITFEGYLAA